MSIGTYLGTSFFVSPGRAIVSAGGLCVSNPGLSAKIPDISDATLKKFRDDDIFTFCGQYGKDGIIPV
jgi:hypothetical protein